MGILARIFNFVPRNGLKGASLGQDAYWEVSPGAKFPSLLKALPKLVPENAILYLEGGSPPKEIKSFLDKYCVPEITHLAMGTIWPRPLVFHLPTTSENLNQLAVLAEKCVAFEVAVHLHVYEQDRIFLEWYDAFFKDPMYLSRYITEDKIKAFCDELSLKYSVYGDYVEPSARSDDAPRSA